MSWTDHESLGKQETYSADKWSETDQKVLGYNINEYIFW